MARVGKRGEIKNSNGNYKSNKIFGWSIFGNLGIDYGVWEILLGYRMNRFVHKDFDNLGGTLNISGSHWTIGVGRGF